MSKKGFRKYWLKLRHPDRGATPQPPRPPQPEPHRDTLYDSPGSLRSDEPIRHTKHDLLDRAKLVDTIANQIFAIDHPEPITIALTAPWGVGKTSFLHLLRNRIAALADEHASAQSKANEPTGEETEAPVNECIPPSGPIVITFNPWLYTKVDDLVQEFFTEICKAINGTQNAKMRQIADDLANGLTPIVDSLFPWVPSETTKWLADKALKKETVREKRDTINSNLEQLSTRLVVFIDDIDRLEADVTKLLFRMVRLIANFKKITYVLAFDRSVVERYLAHDTYESGREYLEKIIQVNYRIPEPQPNVILHILRHELDDVRFSVEQELGQHRAEYGDRSPRPYKRLHRDPDRYERVLSQDFATHFTTVRSIKRYVNALRLALPPVAERIDLVDFYVIELIRLFYPKLYRALAIAADTLVDSSRNWDSDSHERQAHLSGQLKTWMVECVDESAAPQVRKSLEFLLCELFPDLAGVESHPTDRAQWTRRGRACSYANFDSYFMLSAPTDDLPETIARSLDKALSGNALASAEALRECIRSARKRGRIPSLIAHVEARTTELTAREAEMLAKAVCSFDVRDDLQLPDSHEHHRPLSAVVRRCIGKQANENVERVISSVIGEGEALYTVANIFEDIFSAGLRIQDEEEAIDRLKEDVKVKIVSAASEEAFWDGRRWQYLLGLASRFDEKSITETMSDCVAEDGSFLACCESCMDLLETDGLGSEDAIPRDEVLGWLGGIGKERLERIDSVDEEDGERAAALLGRLRLLRQ